MSLPGDPRHEVDRRVHGQCYGDAADPGDGVGADQQQEDAEHKSVQSAGQSYRVPCFGDAVLQDASSGNGTQQDHGKPDMAVEVFQIVQVIQREHIHGDVPGPDMGKTDRNEAPPLPLPDLFTVIAAIPDCSLQRPAAFSGIDQYEDYRADG